jgi:hypothetical protein
MAGRAPGAPDHNGIDLAASSLLARVEWCTTLQMKASSQDRYDVKRKYDGNVDLLAFVFQATSANPEIYVVQYAEIVRDLIEANGYDKNPSWTREDNAGSGWNDQQELASEIRLLARHA